MIYCAISVLVSTPGTSECPRRGRSGGNHGWWRALPLKLDYPLQHRRSSNIPKCSRASFERGDHNSRLSDVDLLPDSTTPSPMGDRSDGSREQNSALKTRKYFKEFWKVKSDLAAPRARTVQVRIPNRGQSVQEIAYLATSVIWTTRIGDNHIRSGWLSSRASDSSRD